jgi:ankyrin repeat protein
LKGSESIVKLLLGYHADVKAPEDRNGSCLECAIIAQKPSLAYNLLDAGAKVNFPQPLDNLSGHYCGFGGPLSASIWHKQDGLTQFLIERGANVNCPGRQPYVTPLQEAVRIDDEGAVKLLVEHSADVNLVGRLNGSALAYAILEERKQGICDKYMQLLLDAGADMNIQGAKRWGVSAGGE